MLKIPLHSKIKYIQSWAYAVPWWMWMVRSLYHRSYGSTRNLELQNFSSTKWKRAAGFVCSVDLSEYYGADMVCWFSMRGGFCLGNRCYVVLSRGVILTRWCYFIIKIQDLKQSATVYWTLDPRDVAYQWCSGSLPRARPWVLLAATS